MAENEGALEDAQTAYDTDLEALRNAPVSDFYAGLSANTIGTENLKQQEAFDISKLSTAREFGEVGTYEDNERATAEGYTGEGYTAQGTNAGQLQRGAASGLSNVFNNLQVSTAGADMANQEADQALAASQDLAAQAGTGAGGATALARMALESKKGVSASIEQQEAANQQMRARGEESLQSVKLNEAKRVQGTLMGEAQRIQAVEADAELFQFGQKEKREKEQLNRKQAQITGQAQAAAQARSDQSAAISSTVSAVGNVAGSFMSAKGTELAGG